jgi:dTDP-4-amino-4,6-dideoxygalactose transaminase
MHFLPLFFDERDRVLQALLAEDIFCSVHYKANYEYALFKSFPRIGDSAEYYQKRELTLPMHVGLSDADLARIVRAVNKVS